MDEQLSHERHENAAEELKPHIPEFPPEVEALTTELIGHIADKWTMLVLEELADGRPLRFTALRKAVPGVSQKMLTQTLRQMERIGLVTRTVHPVIPPRVEYQRTELGHGMGRAVCHLWNWVAEHAREMQAARAKFDAAAKAALPKD